MAGSWIFVMFLDEKWLTIRYKRYIANYAIICLNMRNKESKALFVIIMTQLLKVKRYDNDMYQCYVVLSAGKTCLRRARKRYKNNRSRIWRHSRLLLLLTRLKPYQRQRRQ